MTNTSKKSARPVVAVGVIVFQEDRLLLIRRGKPPKKGEWSLPGGRQELGETLKEAAEREVQEETGLNVQVGPLVDTVDFIEKDGDTILFHYSLIDYMAEVTGGTPKPASDAIDARFFSLDEALNLPLWTETKRIIEKAAQMRQEMR